VPFSEYHHSSKADCSASRLSTLLHVALTNPSSAPKHCLTPKQAALALFLVAFPVQACFVAFVEAAGWVTVDLGIWCWAAYTLTAMTSITLAHWMTNFFWSKELDPEYVPLQCCLADISSYTLPLHSSLIDLFGQLLLVGAFECARIAGRDVMVEGWDL
jgi:solute carrier family 41